MSLAPRKGRGRPNPRLGLLAAALVAAMPASGQAPDAAQHFDAGALAGWPVWGRGEARLRGGVLELREGKDSGGVNLVSPGVLPRAVQVRMRLRPLRHEGVVVVLLSAGRADGVPLTPPTDDSGDLAFWTKGAIQSYFFALHTGFHQPNAFLAVNPGLRDLARVPDPATEERWYDVEVGRDQLRLWLRIDGHLVLEAPVPDPPGLGPGRLVLRLRGPGDGSFGCEVQEMEIAPGPDTSPTSDVEERSGAQNRRAR